MVGMEKVTLIQLGTELQTVNQKQACLSLHSKMGCLIEFYLYSNHSLWGFRKVCPISLLLRLSLCAQLWMLLAATFESVNALVENMLPDIRSTSLNVLKS